MSRFTTIGYSPSTLLATQKLVLELVAASPMTYYDFTIVDFDENPDLRMAKNRISQSIVENLYFDKYLTHHSDRSAVEDPFLEEFCDDPLYLTDKGYQALEKLKNPKTLTAIDFPKGL